jgi:hypothetical protein
MRCDRRVGPCLHRFARWAFNEPVELAQVISCEMLVSAFRVRAPFCGEARVAKRHLLEHGARTIGRSRTMSTVGLPDSVKHLSVIGLAAPAAAAASKRTETEVDGFTVVLQR